MPLKLTRLEQRIEDIENKLINMSDNVSELVSVLKSALIPKPTMNLSSQKYDEQKYIS